MFSNPHIGEVPLDQAIDRFYTADVFMHTWDLARATGQDDRLDPQFCAEMLAGMEPIDELMRSSGQYGPRVPVPDDADGADQAARLHRPRPGLAPLTRPTAGVPAPAPRVTTPHAGRRTHATVVVRRPTASGSPASVSLGQG